MKSLSLIGLLFWSFIYPATAQITITNSVFPAVGDTLHYAFGNQPGAITQIYTPPGVNQQWDLGGLQPTQTWDQVIRHPSSGAYTAYFPGASVMIHPFNSADEVYLKETNTAVKDMGYVGLDPLGLGIHLYFNKQSDLEVTWAPINFFDIRQNASNELTDFPASWAPPFLINLVPTADSFRIRISYQVVDVIDAYGTMTIPGGNFDVLRKKQTEYKTTAMDVHVNPLGWLDASSLGLGQVLPLGTDTTVSFHFLNDVSKEAIAICTLNNAQNEVTGVQYKVVSTPTATVTPTLHAGIVAYPNPVQNTLNVHFESETAVIYQFQLTNAEGRLIAKQELQATAGANDFSIPAAQLVPGIYELTLSHNGISVGSTRIVKN